ncbi:FUSC family protein [Methylorubrum extorquens]
MEADIRVKEAERDRLRIGWLTNQVARLQKRLPVGRRLARGAAHGALSAVAAVIAYLPAQPLGLREGFWGAITALAVAQTEFGAARSVARDQFVGAAIGGVVGVGVSLATAPYLMGYATAVLLAILACWLVNVASAARLSAITATIILLVPHTGTPQRMLASRVFEVGWGICAAIGTVWVVTRINRRLGWTI